MYVKAKVFSSAKKEVFKQIKKNYFEIFVKEKAIRNLANNRVIELFSFHYHIPKNKVRIVNGHRSSSKLLIIDMVQ